MCGPVTHQRANRIGSPELARLGRASQGHRQQSAARFTEVRLGGTQGAAPGLMASAQGAAPPPATAQAAAPGLSRIDRWKSLGEQDQAGVAALIESSGLAKPGLIASWAKGELDANIMKTIDDLFARYMESRG